MPDALDHVISGFSETVNNGDAIWDRANDIDAVNAAAGETVKCGRHAWNDDLSHIFDSPIRHVVSYSYGCSDVVKEMQRRIKLNLPWAVAQWTILVAVNRVLDGQAWEDMIVVPDQVRTAVAFNTVYRGMSDANGLPLLKVIPEACPLRNPGPRRVNYDCFYQGWDHQNIVGKPLVAEFVKNTQYILARQSRVGPFS